MALLFSREGLIMLLIVLLWVGVWAVIGQDVTDALVGELESMELTKHAQEAHLGQAYTASSIRDEIVTKKCQPEYYVCLNDTEVLYCIDKLDPLRAIGLVIGRTSRKIVTGFVGPTKYWQDRCP